MKKAIVLFSLLLSVSGFAQTDVSGYVPGKSQDAVTYFLPKTIIEVEVEATKVTYTPGEFCKYADRYLRLTGISDQESSYWEISKVTVKPVGMPDPDNVYSVKLKDKTIAPLMELTEDGIIKSINKPLEKKTGKKAAEASQQQKTKINPRDFMTEEILMASSSAKMAELVAKEIYNIRDSKNAIIRGQADNMPKDGEAMKLMLANLEAQEAAMLEMFTGTTDRETKKYTLRLVPNKDLNKQVLFRFSKRLGVVANDDLSGVPVYVTLNNLNTVPAPDEKAKSEKKKIEGIVYNVPGKAQLTIFNSNKTYYDGTLPITQFGNQETLADNLFNKKTTTQVTFDPVTGGLVRIERGNE